ncbi:MAG: diaminopimelate epimerase [Candidatus Hydrothermales bacterium]
MKLNFFKMEGTGNDFIVFFNVNPKKVSKFISALCDRKRGIGADGVLFSLEDKEFDFKMIYFNSDGKRAKFCANGARCLIYLNYLKTKKRKFNFIADDGKHYGEYLGNNLVKLKVLVSPSVKNICISDKEYTLIDTGVPHLICEEEDIDEINVIERGAFLRYHKLFEPEGTNVDFISIIDENKVKIRTYERGVEDEVLSCGTGAVAAAFYLRLKNKKDNFEIFTRGGDTLKVTFINDEAFLIGKVNLTFKGEINLKSLDVRRI